MTLSKTVRSFCTPALLAAVLMVPAMAAEHKAPAARPAAEYAASDAHAQEHVTVAAEPCDDPKQCPFFRLEYVQHGFIPVRVIFTNDGDAALSLDDARMQFMSAHGDKLPAATDEDLNRRLFTTKSALPGKVPLLPIPIHHTPVDKKITEDNNDFGFRGTIVNPHTTMAGYLFYDVRGLDEPALRGAELYIKQVHTLDGKQELFAFTLPFDKWLQANPSAPSNSARK